MTDHANESVQDDAAYHTYTTHRIPWFVHLIWIGYVVGAIWYIIRYVIPSASQFL